MLQSRTRKLPTRARDLPAQRMGLPGLLHTLSPLPHLLWEARLVQVVMVAPVGVVDHQEDLQVDHQEVMEVTLEMGFPEVRSPDLGTQFQQPGLSLWAPCALRHPPGILVGNDQVFARG